MGKIASLACPSSYQDLWGTSKATVGSPGATAYRLPCQDAPCYFCCERHAGAGLVGKEASLACPSSYQDLRDTSEAMGGSSGATAYRLPCHKMHQFCRLRLNFEPTASCYFCFE